MGRRALDLAGQTFGQLTAQHRAGCHNKKGALWKCVCTCGKELVVSATDLNHGGRTSCGCARFRRRPPRSPDRMVTAHGKTMSLTAWSRELGVAKATLSQRLRNGWSPDEAMLGGNQRRNGLAWRTELYDGARDLPWESDWIARLMVSEWGPMTVEEVSDVMGLSLPRIDQIEKQAFAKIADALGAVDTKAMLRLLDEMRTERVLPANGHEGEAA